LRVTPRWPFVKAPHEFATPSRIWITQATFPLPPYHFRVCAFSLFRFSDFLCSLELSQPPEQRSLRTNHTALSRARLIPFMRSPFPDPVNFEARMFQLWCSTRTLDVFASRRNCLADPSPPPTYTVILCDCFCLIGCGRFESASRESCLQVKLITVFRVSAPLPLFFRSIASFISVDFHRA